MDGRTWDVRGVFKVTPKGSNKEVIYDTTSGTVAGSGLDQFGTSNPDNPKSAPAASLTYNILVYMPDFADYSPAIVLNTRSAVKPAKDLFGKIGMKPTDPFGQIYKMLVQKDQGAEGPYNNYRYVFQGFATDDQYALCKELYERFNTTTFRASDEGEEASEAGAQSTKF
jgi:hypothetical protein